MNISTGEAVLSQICDNQFYARTINKLHVFDPTEILIVSTSGPPNPKSKMYSVVEENIVGAKIVTVDRKYWSESAGLEYIQHLAFFEDAEAIKVAVEGNYFATCCFAAVGSFAVSVFFYPDPTGAGSKIHRPQHVSDFRLPLPPNQVSSFGRFYDD